MAKRTRHAGRELVRPEYVARYTRKGWMERNFNIAGTWFLWRKNITTERGVYRFGVIDKDGAYERTLERA